MMSYLAARIGIGWIALVCCALAIPAAAIAQEEAPLRLSYVQVGDDGDESFETVTDVLKASARIERISERRFRRAFGSLGLDEQVLVDSEHWPRIENYFAAAMWDVDAEGVLIHRVTDQGARLMIDVIGPEGTHLGTAQRDLEAGRLSEGEAQEILREIFSSLVPQVRQFRQDVASGGLDDSDFQIDDEAEPPGGVASLSPRERAIIEHRRRYGDMGQYLAIQVGPLTGQRTMQMSQSEGTFRLSHRSYLMGVGARVDGLVTTIDRETAAFEVSGFIGYSPLRTTFEDQELRGQWFRMGVDGRYINARSARTRLRVIAGVETSNLSLTANDHYTGHGYLMGRLGGGIQHALGGMVTISADGLWLPAILASNSGGAYGTPQGLLGFGGQGAVRFDLLEPLMVGLFYDFIYVDQQYSQPQVINNPPQGTDIYHQVLVGLGYKL